MLFLFGNHLGDLPGLNFPELALRELRSFIPFYRGHQMVLFFPLKSVHTQQCITQVTTPTCRSHRCMRWRRSMSPAERAAQSREVRRSSCLYRPRSLRCASPIFVRSEAAWNGTESRNTFAQDSSSSLGLACASSGLNA